MVTKTEGSFTNTRGQKLHTVSWVPESPKAVFIWHHGIGEYCLRFEPVFTPAFTDAGIAVFTFDAHGHGQSEPLDEKNRVFVNKFSDLVDDAVQYLEDVEKVVSAWPTKPPIFQGGNSLGGLISSFVALKKQDMLAGLILQSPAVDVPWNLILRIQAAMGNMLAAMVPHAKLVPAVRAEDMSQDPKWVEAYIADKNLYHGNTRARTANEVLKAFGILKRQAKDLKLPIYGIHGTIDRTTSLPAFEEFLSHVSSTDKTLYKLEGGYHELFFGPDRPATQEKIIGWMAAHSSPTASL